MFISPVIFSDVLYKSLMRDFNQSVLEKIRNKTYLNQGSIV